MDKSYFTEAFKNAQDLDYLRAYTLGAICGLCKSIADDKSILTDIRTCLEAYEEKRKVLWDAIMESNRTTSQNAATVQIAVSGP